MRLRLDLAYDGTDFHGWASQPSLRTVQQTLEDALALVLRLDDVPLTCAGRTDAGVHARGQVVHLDVEAGLVARVGGRGSDTPGQALRRRLNGILPADVRVHAVAEAAGGFDARFSARWRRYAYRIADAPELVDPLMRSVVLARPRPLDLTAMNEAAAQLVGEHDFSAFCRRRPGATCIRTLQDLTWARDASGLAVAGVRADAFCHSMVRALVGCLVAVGEGRQRPGWASDILRAGRRDPAVTVIAARGLTLEEVSYPADHELAGRARAARTLRTLSEQPSGDATDG